MLKLETAKLSENSLSDPKNRMAPRKTNKSMKSMKRKKENKVGPNDLGNGKQTRIMPVEARSGDKILEDARSLKRKKAMKKKGEVKGINALPEETTEGSACSTVT